MRLTVNGRQREVSVSPEEVLAATLRGRLQLTGTKVGCERGECGACTVLLNGRPVYSCLALTVACEGAVVTTIEGVSDGTDLHPVQRAFIATDAAQCGFCTPGQVLAAMSLLARTPSPTEEEIDVAMSGNLCRCGTYPRIREAIRGLAEGTVP